MKYSTELMIAIDCRMVWNIKFNYGSRVMNYDNTYIILYVIKYEKIVSKFNSINIFDLLIIFLC